GDGALPDPSRAPRRRAGRGGGDGGDRHGPGRGRRGGAAAAGGRPVRRQGRRQEGRPGAVQPRRQAVPRAVPPGRPVARSLLHRHRAPLLRRRAPGRRPRRPVGGGRRRRPPPDHRPAGRWRRRTGDAVAGPPRRPRPRPGRRRAVADDHRAGPRRPRRRPGTAGSRPRRRRRRRHQRRRPRPPERRRHHWRRHHRHHRPRRRHRPPPPLRRPAARRPQGRRPAVTGTWDPAQYRRFAAERRQPFDDLVALCTPVAGGSVVDLGCGPGNLTAELHDALRAARTVGVDSSAAMLADAPTGVPGLSFVQGDLAAWDTGPVDVVFANASLQWVDDHPTLLARLRRGLRPGGQLAFQVPANFGHPSHRLAREVAAEAPFAAAGGVPADRGAAVLAPTAYAECLDDLGATHQHVRLQVYGHHLDGPDAVVEWVGGTLLTPYRNRLDPDTYQAFVDRYRRRLTEELGDRRPYFYAFPRILCWARFP